MKLKLITLAISAVFLAGFLAGQSNQKIVEKIVMVETQVPVFMPVPRSKQKYIAKQREILAAAIPLSALRVSK